MDDDKGLAMPVFRSCLILCFFYSGHSVAQSLRLNTEQTPPSRMRVDGVVLGHETDKIREIMDRTGTTYTIEVVPWKCAYTNALLCSALTRAHTRQPGH